MMNSDILVVIDMQNDFIDGSLGTPEAQAIVPNVRAKILKYMEEKKPIIFTQDTHWRDYLDETLEGKYLPVEHCIKGTDGWKLSENVVTRSEIIDILHYMNQEIGSEGYFNTDDFIFEKDTFGTLGISSTIRIWIIDDYLMTERPSIEICGLCTDICVVTNALILREQFPNSEIICDASCCAGTTPQKHEAALDVMESCQIKVIR